MMSSTTFVEINMKCVVCDQTSNLIKFTDKIIIYDSKYMTPNRYTEYYEKNSETNLIIFIWYPNCYNFLYNLSEMHVFFYRWSIWW